MLEVFFITMGLSLIPISILSLYPAIMGSNGGIIKLSLSLITISFGILLLVAGPVYLTMSIMDYIIDLCRNSHQTLLTSITGIIILYRGFRAETILIKIFYLLSGSILIWYGVNYGYGNLNWYSILIFSISSAVIETISAIIEFRRNKDNDHLVDEDDEIQKLALQREKSTRKHILNIAKRLIKRKIFRQ